MVERNTHQTRVLIVDGQDIIIEKLRRELGGHSDIVCEVVTDARLAVVAAMAFRPTVILQDLVMPELDGFELIRRYRNTVGLESVPVIVLSANEGAEPKRQSFADGANDYLVKIPERIELLARLR